MLHSQALYIDLEISAGGMHMKYAGRYLLAAWVFYIASWYYLSLLMEQAQHHNFISTLLGICLLLGTIACLSLFFLTLFS